MGTSSARRADERREERRVSRPSGRSPLRGLALTRVALCAGLCALGTLVALGAAGGGGAAAAAEDALYTGLGFDTCNAPSIPALQSWLASPYRALGIYIGGANRACENSQLTAGWVVSARQLGWALAPLYVGLQAPCSLQAGVARIDAADAAAQGTSAGASAGAAASELGLPAGSPLYYDMEGYALDDPACTQAVQTFLSAWVVELHAAGYLAGVYGSAASTMRDLQALTTTAAAPDDVWIADWNGDTGVFGDPYVSDLLWTNHQRIHQFSGGHNETYDGVTLNIDGDSLDGAVVAASGVASTPPNPPPPTTTTTPPTTSTATTTASTPLPTTTPPTTTPPTASTLSAAGSVATADGVADVSWPAATFSRSVVVSLTPSLPSAPVAGFGSGGYGVRLEVQQTASEKTISSFTGPLTISIAAQPGSLAPAYSPDGSSWAALPELVGDLLPVGVAAAYAREPDGSIEIQTRNSGFFALLPDTTPPPPPAHLSGHFAYGSLVLSWPASTGPAGNAVGYQVSLGDQPLLTVSGETTAALRAFHPDAPSVYRVRAIDAAGTLSAPSARLVVLPSKRPASVPDRLPPWAWSLFAWQLQGEIGPRPSAPNPAPRWYWTWRAWRVAPFHLAPE